jgi:hypothetical protein
MAKKFAKTLIEQSRINASQVEELKVSLRIFELQKEEFQKKLNEIIAKDTATFNKARSLKKIYFGYLEKRKTRMVFGRQRLCRS